MPSSARRLGAGAFAGCASLREAVLPEGAQGVPERLFSDCAALRRVFLPGTVRTVSERAFYGCASLAAIALPAGCAVEDLTCPFVDKLHHIAEEASADGSPVIVVGERSHPEVAGTVGWIRSRAWVVATPEEAELLPEMARATVCSQTTFPPKVWDAVVAVLRRKVEQLTEKCTICPATEIRQREARELAARSDAMIVVGGRHSANTARAMAAPTAGSKV